MSPINSRSGGGDPSLPALGESDIFSLISTPIYGVSNKQLNLFEDLQPEKISELGSFINKKYKLMVTVVYMNVMYWFLSEKNV